MTSNSDQIANSAVKGIFWIGGGQVIKQIVGILTYVMLARLLTTDDFGLMSMVMVFVSFSMMFVEFGIGTAIVHSKELSDSTLCSAFWINLAAAAVLSLVLAIASPLVAWIYHKPELSELILVLSLTLLLSGLQVVPRALLQRSLHFYPIARAEAISSTVAAASAVFLAWRGFGVWALVMQPVVGNAMLLLMYSLSASWLPRFIFNWKDVKSTIHYSLDVFGSNLMSFFNSNADDFLIGKFLGSTPLGYYSLAFQIMLYPLQNVSTIIVRVLFPSLTQLQNDLPRFRSLYLKAVSSIALITFPMMLGLFALAEQFVFVVFGEAWMNMLGVLKIFCFLGMVQSVFTTLGTIYLSTGNTRLMLRVYMYSTPVFILAFVAGLPWGIEGVALNFTIVQSGVYLVSLILAFRLVDMAVLDFFRVMSRPLLVSVLMSLSVVLSQRALMANIEALANNPFWQLLSGVLTGMVVYVGLSLVLNRQQFLDIGQKLLSVVRKK